MAALGDNKGNSPLNLFPHKGDRTYPPLFSNNKPACTVEEMDAEIRLVARFHSLIIWRIPFSMALLCFEFMCIICHLYVLSAVYILLIANLLPVILAPFLAPHIRKSTPVLPFLRKRYHYSSLRYKTAELSFFITGMFLVLWQLFNSVPAYPVAWLYKFPVLLLAASLFWRVAAPIIFSIRIRRNMGLIE